MSETHRTVGVFGATGFIGGALSERLQKAGWEVVRFSRNPPADDPGWRAVTDAPDLGGLGAVVNLAGESIAKRWTAKTWRRIWKSRVGLTTSIVKAMERMGPGERPAVLVNASAVGLYASSGDLRLRESAPPGAGPLGRLCRDWEAAAVEAEALGVRVVRLRTGLVLGEGGEAWDRLRKLFRLGLGGRLGAGNQWMSWIHLDDEVGAIEFALDRPDLRGPLNLGSPTPVTNREFTRMLAAAAHRPAFLHVPTFALRLALGGFAESLLGSFRMVPARLEEAGYPFRFRTLDEALRDLLG